MWSDKYYYFEIRSDDAYSQTTGASELLKYLIKDLHFIADGVDGVEGNSDQPWMKLSLVVASINGSFSTQKSCPEQINLISVVGSKTTGDVEAYSTILNKVATWLGWEFIELDASSND